MQSLETCGLLLSTNLCEVCIQCWLVLYASVHDLCAIIYRYKCKYRKSKYTYLLEF